MPTKKHDEEPEKPESRESAAVPAAAERVSQLESELEELRNRHLRLAADFDNYKKRARQEQADTIQYASATLVERLLPVIDDLERAIHHAPEAADPTWLKGVELTFQKLMQVLESQGVRRIESVGSRFDPSVHEAVVSEVSAEHPEDTVLDELRSGYRLHDRVVRPALVKVARQPALAEPSEPA